MTRQCHTLIIQLHLTHTIALSLTRILSLTEKKIYFVGVVKTLNSVLKGTGFESYQDNVRFVLEQENLLQLLQSTQVRMGTWPFGRFVLSKTKNAKTPDGCGVQCVMCLLLAGGVIVCKRLGHCYAVDKRYINAIFTFTFYQNDK